MREEGWQWARLLLAAKARLLAGTGVEVAPAPAKRLLQHLGFGSTTNVDLHEWGRYAMRPSRGASTWRKRCSLLDNGARIDHPLFFYSMEGMASLISAAVFDGNALMIRLLLARGADAARLRAQDVGPTPVPRLLTLPRRKHRGAHYGSRPAASRAEGLKRNQPATSLSRQQSPRNDQVARRSPPLSIVPTIEWACPVGLALGRGLRSGKH